MHIPSHRLLRKAAGSQCGKRWFYLSHPVSEQRWRWTTQSKLGTNQGHREGLCALACQKEDESKQKAACSDHTRAERLLRETQSSSSLHLGGLRPSPFDLSPFSRVQMLRCVPVSLSLYLWTRMRFFIRFSFLAEVKISKQMPVSSSLKNRAFSEPFCWWAEACADSWSICFRYGERAACKQTPLPYIYTISRS